MPKNIVLDLMATQAQKHVTLNETLRRFDALFQLLVLDRDRTLQSTGMGFFGICGATGALGMTLTLSAVVDCSGIDFQRGTHNNSGGTAAVVAYDYSGTCLETDY